MPAEPAKGYNWFELIVEGSRDAIVLSDQDQRVIVVNRSAEILFGYSRSELLGQSSEILFPERDRADYREHAQFRTVPSARPFGEGRELFGLRKDGTEFPLEITLSPIETPVGWISLASMGDISERRRYEERADAVAALVESADDAIVTKNLHGIVLSWNPGAERLLGYSAGEMIGQPVTKMIPDDRQEEEAGIIERISNGQRVSNFETIRRTRDGKDIDVSLTISPVRDRFGRVVGASKIMRDITLRKRAEFELRRSNAKLEQTNADLNDFVYTASHDLRAPLTGIATVAQWILQDDATLTIETRDRLALIGRRIDRMKRLLSDIRDYARTGEIDETPGAPLSAAALVNEVVAVSHIPPGFSVTCDPSLATVQVHRRPLEQVLHNLINNAIKHHDRDTGSVTVSVKVNGPWLRFSVIDDGPGIPAEYRKVIFEMFQTLKPRDEKEGSGMGLALVRKLVGSMGGTCAVEPVGERGSLFWFEWPLSGQAVRDGYELF